MLSALSISEYVDHRTLQDHSRIFPTKPITLVVPYAAGGGTDITARALAKTAEKHLGQPIIVVNRTGGGGSVGLMEGAEAQADGYTVTYLVAELTMLPHLGLLPLTYERFKPLLQTNMDPSAITVRADAPWKTAEAFLEDAEAHPGKLKMGNAGTGSIWHLAAAILEQKSGVLFTHIISTWRGLAVPKDTPDAVAQTLTDALFKGTKDEEFREEMRKHGLGLRVQDAEAFARQLKESHDTFARLIPELGLSRK